MHSQLLRLGIVAGIVFSCAAFELTAQSTSDTHDRVEALLDSAFNATSGDWFSSGEQEILVAARAGRQLDSTCVPCWFAVGALSDSSDERLHAYDKVLALTADNTRVEARLFATLWRGLELLRLHRDEQALADLREFVAGLTVVGRDQSWIRDYFAQVFAWPQLRRWPTEMVTYSDRIHHHSDDSRTLFRRGRQLKEIRDTVGALRDFARALEVQPDLHSCRLARAELLTELGRLAESHQDLDQILVSDPTHVEALLARGAQHSRMGDTAGALSDLRTAAAVAPNEAEPAWRYGELLVDAARYDDAVAFFTTVVEGKRGSEDSSMRGGALAEIGRAQYRAGTYEKSIESSQRAFAIDSSAVVAYRIGLALLRLGRTSEAMQQYRGVVNGGYASDEAIADLRQLLRDKVAAPTARAILKEVFAVSD